jgi:hypothetical protein
MSKKQQLITTANLVKTILETEPQTRNSDSLLYLKVLEHCATQKDVNLHLIPVTAFLSHYIHEYDFPCFETVRRSRQKIQSEHPELKANETVQAHRKAYEPIYKDFAKDVIV